MTREEMKSLKQGDIVRHRYGHGESFVITSNYGEYVIGVRTMHMTNPDEWMKVGESRRKQYEVVPRKEDSVEERGDC